MSDWVAKHERDKLLVKVKCLNKRITELEDENEGLRYSLSDGGLSRSRFPRIFAYKERAEQAEAELESLANAPVFTLTKENEILKAENKRLIKAITDMPDHFIFEHDDGCNFGWWDKGCTCSLHKRIDDYIKQNIQGGKK